MIKVHELKAKVIIHPYKKPAEDITDSVKHISIVQTIGQPAGHFEISLLPTRDKRGTSYYYRFSPMDYVTISFARYPDNYQELPPVMRGFIDNVNLRISVGSRGEPQREYSIIGRDYGKIFQICQIYYLSMKPEAMMANRLIQKYKVPMDGPPDKILASLFEIGIDQLKDVKKGCRDIPDMQFLASTDVEGYVHTLSVQQWDRDLWGLMSHYDNAPWNELYWLELEKPTLVFRKTPWINPDEEGYIQGNDKLYDQTLRYVHLSPSDIINLDFTRSDAETRNYFYTFPQMSILGDVGTKAMALLNSKGNEEELKTNPYMIDKDDEYAGRERYGFRYYETASEYFSMKNGMPASELDSKQPNYMDTAEKFNKWLVQAMRKNSAFECGQFVLKSNENIKPGYYLKWQEGVYYVPQVRHDLCFVNKQESFRTTALVTRGTNYLAYRKKYGSSQNSKLELASMGQTRTTSESASEASEAKPMGISSEQDNGSGTVGVKIVLDNGYEYSVGPQ